MPDSPYTPDRLPDWEAFYRDYRKPGYVSGFEITTKLGGGMFGLVFRARKESIGKDYAIKFLKVEDGEVRQALLAELEQVQYFAQIDHPNLVQIEDRGEVDGIPYLVMQFAGSETLRDRMTENGEPPSAELAEELRRWFMQACKGTAALHERSLVHFDLKPANVFLKGAVARVGDYGLSKLVTHSRGSLSMGRGTPYYMAPEMLQRRGDQRSDIYSLGVMLYELLCGRVPFTGDSEWEVLRKHETEPPHWPPHLSTVERTVLARCLQKGPAARFQSVHDLITALGPSLGQPAAVVARATGAMPPPPPAEDPALQPPPLPPPEVAEPPCVPPPLPRRKRSSAHVVAVPLVLVVLAAVFLVTSRFGDDRERSRGERGRISNIHSGVNSTRAPDTLRGRVDAFVAEARRTALANANRERATRLRDIEFEKMHAPRDIYEYVRMVEQLAEAREFSAGHALKLSRFGRPVFLAAVASLQDFDYGEIDDCRCAAHTMALLAQMTGLSGMSLDPPLCDPGESDTCRFQSHADSWRRLAERYAATDDDFSALLASRKGSGW